MNILHDDDRHAGVIAHHRAEQQKVDMRRKALLAYALKLTRRAGVKVTRADLSAKTDHQLRIVISAAQSIVS